MKRLVIFTFKNKINIYILIKNKTHLIVRSASLIYTYTLPATVYFDMLTLQKLKFHTSDEHLYKRYTYIIAGQLLLLKVYVKQWSNRLNMAIMFFVIITFHVS